MTLIELFRALMLVLAMSSAAPHMGCNYPPGRETVCWVVDNGRTQYLTPGNVQRHWPQLVKRWGIKLPDAAAKGESS